ncbi:hypothetical protein V495_08328 [Pseudogymnoascus sp. VKM F-4514 (FW-929)]|nr:hypothetical protein V490_07923 [Pseudogymnoascus sp. VKM F-3557]KFY33298.1 hypothetical protein V495_08328 [Pseudogymnoascus sp. VKM F-4514 (FW-929)]KFY58626.1 hypothetical protein V497_04735 [Pseudogymnoascus sp. VKM F-4516 (FW-969)]
MSDPFNQYKTEFDNHTGAGDERPTALRVVEDNVAPGSFTGKVALITGGTNGIGLETAVALHSTGADVYFTARDAAKGEKSLKEIKEKSKGTGKLDVIPLDLDSLESVRKAAKIFLEKSNKLNILINNAGIMATPYSQTADGFERQFGVNHLAHFLLTALLLPTLEASSTANFNSRVVNVSSSSHRYSKVDFDNYNYTKETYERHQAYGQSKTANIWTANYIDRVYGPRGVHAFSLHPGGIFSGLTAYLEPEMVAAFKADPSVLVDMLTPEQGAATSVWAAVGKVLEGKGGLYLANCTIAPPENPDEMKSVQSPRAAPWVKGETEAENKLWELSAKLVGENPQ